MSGTQLWIVTFLTIITNGFALVGLGQMSSGGLARGIECKHEIAHNIEMAGTQRLMAGNPPNRSSRFESEVFTIVC